MNTDNFEYIPITIAKEDYKPELTTMNEKNTFELHNERVKDNRTRGYIQIMHDYLVEEFDRRFLKEWNNATTNSD